LDIEGGEEVLHHLFALQPVVQQANIDRGTGTDHAQGHRAVQVTTDLDPPKDAEGRRKKTTVATVVRWRRISWTLMDGMAQRCTAL
jgi:hypothetical protein